MKTLIISILCVLTTGAVFAEWSRLAVNSGGAPSQNPSLAVDGDGDVHVVWSEKTGHGWGTFYKSKEYEDSAFPQEKLTVHDDDGIVRWNWDRGDQQPHIAVNPDTDEIGIAFIHRNPEGFYFGCEQACLFYKHSYDHHSFSPYLRAVSGMAEHVISPEILFNPYVNNDFFIFWSQHDKMSDINHDIYYNYRATETYGAGSFTGFQFVKQANDMQVGDLQMGLASAVNDSEDNGTPTDRAGDMYIVSTDRSDKDPLNSTKLILTRYDAADGFDPDPVTIPNTDSADAVDAAYYYLVGGENSYHKLFIAYSVVYKAATPPNKLNVIYTLDPEQSEIQWSTPINFQFSKQNPSFSLQVDSAGAAWIAYVALNNGVYVKNLTTGVLHEIRHNCKLHASLDMQIVTFLDSSWQLKEEIHIAYSESEYSNPLDQTVYWSKYVLQ